MKKYKYVTVLEAQDSGKPPNDNIDDGDKIVKAGKHETDSIQYLDDQNNMHSIHFEQVAVYGPEEYMTEQEAQELAKARWFDDE